MCRLTEQVVFSDPYKVSEYNRWTTPHLDKDVEAVQGDNLLKLEVAHLKSMYTYMNSYEYISIYLEWISFKMNVVRYYVGFLKEHRP